MESPNTHPKAASTKKRYSKYILPSLLMFTAVCFALYIPCPTNTLKFILYTVTSISVALFFPQSAKTAVLDLSKILNITFKVAGSIALSLILYVWDPISHFGEDKCGLGLKETVIFIEVRNESGEIVRQLKEKGSVVFTPKSGLSRTYNIDSHGMSTISNVHQGDTFKLSVEFSEPYENVSPDSLYIVRPDSTYKLKIWLKGSDLVYGTVLFNQKPLPDVRVTVENTPLDLTDSTDTYGRFKIPIPKTLRSNRYSLLFAKDGFLIERQPATPQVGPLIITMRK